MPTQQMREEAWPVSVREAGSGVVGYVKEEILTATALLRVHIANYLSTYLFIRMDED